MIPEKVDLKNGLIIRKQTINPRQKKLLTVLAKNDGSKTNRELLVEAGYSPKTHLPDVLEKRSIQQFIEKTEQNGITDEYLITKIRKVVDDPDGGKALNAIKFLLQARYPELRPYFKVDIDQRSITINHQETLTEAYQVVAEAHKLTVEDVKERLAR